MQLDPSAPGAESSDSPAPNSRVLRRSAGGRYLGGVAGGIARHFSIDPFTVRAGVLGSTLFTAYALGGPPIVPAAYTVLWLVLPGETGASVARNIRTPSGRREGVAAIASFAVIALLLTRPVFGVALALAALAWVMLSDGPDAPTAPEPERIAGPPASHARWGRTRRSERGETLVEGFRRAKSRRRRGPALWPLTLSLLAILAVAGAMADAAMDPGVDPALLVNIALIIVGGVLVLSAWRGRALSTVLIAVALLPAWVGFSVADVGRFAGSGSVTYTPREIPDTGTLDYENGYGSMTIDLRAIPFEDGDDLSLNVRTTAGNVTVLAPPSTETVVRSKIGLGTAAVQGNGLGFYEYDREPFLDRFMIRRYQAQGSGCVREYWAAWALLVATHDDAGVNLSGLSANEEDDVEPILAAIVLAGFEEPVPIDEYQTGGEYEDPGFDPGIGSYRVIDEFGNEYYVENGPLPIEVEEQIRAAQPPFRQAVQDRTWSYSADLDGVPCIARPPSANPPTIEINATVGIGTLEVRRDDF